MDFVRLLIASACIALLTGCESPPSGVDDHDIAVAAQQLESIAREGEWLAQAVEARTVNLGMAWVHQKALAEDAVAVSKDLARPVPAGLRDEHERVMAMAVRLEEQVNRIAPSAAEPAQLRSLEHELESLAQSAHPLRGKS